MRKGEMQIKHLLNLHLPRITNANPLASPDEKSGRARPLAMASDEDEFSHCLVLAPFGIKNTETGHALSLQQPAAASPCHTTFGGWYLPIWFYESKRDRPLHYMEKGRNKYIFYWALCCCALFLIPSPAGVCAVGVLAVGSHSWQPLFLSKTYI